MKKTIILIAMAAMAAGASAQLAGTTTSQITAIGTGAVATGVSGYGDNVAVGSNSATTLGPSNVAVGANASAGNGSTVVGAGAAANAAGVALGASSTANNSSVALGTQAQATAFGSVAIGAGTTNSVTRTVAVGNVGFERRITNVATGTGSNDAVNLSQMQTAIAASGGVDSVARASATLALSGGAHDAFARERVRNAQADATTALTGGAHDELARRAATRAEGKADIAIEQSSKALSLARDAKKTAAAAGAAAAALVGATPLELPEKGEVAVGMGVGAFAGSGAIAVQVIGRIENPPGILPKQAFWRVGIAAGSKTAISVGVSWKF